MRQFYHPPAGRPRVDLALADTAPQHHDLYVKITGPADPDTMSPSLTLDILRYAHSHIPDFKAMGIEVKVTRITSSQLRVPQLVEAMRRRGISSLPALVTPVDVLRGPAEIKGHYERCFGEFRARARRDERPVEDTSLDDMANVYIASDMTMERFQEDQEDDGMDEQKEMMAAYTRRMAHRPDSKARPAHPGPPPVRRLTVPEPTPRPPARPDNVRGADMDGDDINATIARLSQGIDSGSRRTAFTAESSDSADQSAGDDPKDADMERHYYANMEEST